MEKGRVENAWFLYVDYLVLCGKVNEDLRRWDDLLKYVGEEVWKAIQILGVFRMSQVQMSNSIIGRLQVGGRLQVLLGP